MENEIKNFVELPVTGGYVTKVDPDIADKIKGKSIYLNCKKKPYAVIRWDKYKVKLHRFILNPKDSDIVDHINGDIMDNRRENLRICSYSLNGINSHKICKNSSGFRGVTYRKRERLFHAEFMYNKKRYSLGYFRNNYIACIFKDTLVRIVVRAKVSLNFNHSVHEGEIIDFLEKTNGRIFKLCFVKRTDGSFREMICRTGVSKNIKGKGMAFDPSINNLSVVYDMKNKSYKCIPLENIVCLKFEKKNYLVTRKRLVA